MLNKEWIDIIIQKLNQKIARKNVENEQCRRTNSSRDCYHITKEIKNLYKELERMYKLYKKDTGEYHEEDLPF